MDILHRATRFSRNEEGSILILVALSLAAFFGFLALTFDLGRVAVTQTELQSYADNVALAAAGELDGSLGARARATSAASAMIVDSQTFGSGGAALSSDDFVLTFLRSLPGNDSAPITATNFATSDNDARFVRVEITGRNVRMSFGAAAAALNGTAFQNPDVGATAVAGFSLMACDITPMMFCLPSDPTWRAENSIGHMVKLRAGGNNAAWGPGNFGFLKLDDVIVDESGPCAGMNGAQRTRCLLGSTDFITRCFAQNGVDTDPGQSVGINDISLNVRFDIYSGNFKGRKDDPNYAPAPNIIKGVTHSQASKICEPDTASPDTVSLPKDSCFASGSCTRFGDGIFDLNGYLNKNYLSSRPNPAYDPADPASPQMIPAVALTPADIPAELTGAENRYALYLAEIALAKEIADTNFSTQVPVSDPPTPEEQEQVTRRTHLQNLRDYSVLGPHKTETSLPQCSSSTPGAPERRMLIAAGVDCVSNPINGAEVGVPVKEFVELFMTHPVGMDGTSSSVDIWAEITGTAGGGAGGGGSIIRDLVQLYR